MAVLFTICAAIGCTVMIFQLVLTLIGFGGEALDVDMPDDMDADVDVDIDVDTHFDVDSDMGSHIDSSWFFGVISFRTIVAALAFFGLAGLMAQSAGANTLQTLAIAIASGLVAMYIVYWLVKSMRSLHAEGTPRIHNAVGKQAKVYITIPAKESGMGKIQINLQNRTMEYQAITTGDKLVPGATVVIVDVVTSDTVAVEPFLESQRDDNVS